MGVMEGAGVSGVATAKGVAEREVGVMEGAGVSGDATAKGVAEGEVAVVMVCNVFSAVAMLPALVMVEGSLIEGRTGLVGGFNNRLVDWVVVS